jgi:hypothetical protein
MREPTRRRFLDASLALACAGLFPWDLVLPGASAQTSPKTNPLDGMKWLNEPASGRSAGQLSVVTRPKADFWRKTFSG